MHTQYTTTTMSTKLVVAIVLLSGCIVQRPASRGKFMSFKHWSGSKRNLLILKVDKPQWKIGYRLAADCPADFRQKERELKTAMTTALHLWLKPLHELKPAHPITNDFLYLRQDDFHGDRDKAALRELDARVTFECRIAGSIAWIATVSAPDIYIRNGTNIDKHFLFGLIHELGHAFGLEDTYVMRDGKMKNKGGLESTVGTQPASIMSGWTADEPDIRISEDDVRGIVWLYKHFHEELPIKDCFFPDYVLEEDPRGCRPNYPLIFEIKHGYPNRSIRMLDEDPKLDVNAQDAGGFTALHYAVMYEQEEVVETLLAERDIKPFLRDKRGRSALALAREAKLDHMIVLLLKHPLTLSVDAKGKKPVTWGELKKGDH